MVASVSRTLMETVCVLWSIMLRRGQIFQLGLGQGGLVEGSSMRKICCKDVWATCTTGLHITLGSNGIYEMATGVSFQCGIVYTITLEHTGVKECKMHGEDIGTALSRYARKYADM